MKAIYLLSEDVTRIRHVQEATLHRDDAGLKITHGLYGSEDWWDSIKSGVLHTTTIKGVISKVYMSGHNDYPEFEILSNDGHKTSWTRDVNNGFDDNVYKVGKKIEIDFVLQKFKNVCPILGEDSKCVIEIRIENEL